MSNIIEQIIEKEINQMNGTHKKETGKIREVILEILIIKQEM